MGLKIYLLCTFLFAGALQAATLGLNDVSILLPLPTDQSNDRLFRASTNGAHGELLPRTLYDLMPELLLETSEQTFQKLRVVGIRLDPCFPTTAEATQCQPQIRLIWQPMDIPSFDTHDAAIHTFYDLTEADFNSTITQLENLRDTLVGTTSAPLSINPQLLALGLDSAYANELFRIVLAQTGARRLSQATFMQLAGAGNVWIFGGFTVRNGVATSMTIPRTGGLTQTFFNNPIRPNYFSNAGPSPAPQGADTFNLIMRDSRSLNRANEAEVSEGTMATFRIENPTAHNPHTVDCVSCHVAQSAQLTSIKQFPWLMLDLRGEQFRYVSQFNLTNLSRNAAHTTLLRSFGYDRREPAINQRVINETAQVLERLYP